MDAQLNTQSKNHGWRALFRTIKNLRLPWIWVIVGLSLNLILSELMLKLPDTTANLLGGQLTGSAIMEAITYYVVLGAITFLMVIGQVQAQTYSVNRARESLWKKMLIIKMDYFDKNDPSDLMSTITNDANEALTSFINIIIYLIPNFYYVVKALMRISEYHWLLAASCFALLPVKYVYALIMGKKFQKNTAAIYEKIGSLTGFLADRINHLSLIKTHTNENKENDAGRDASQKLLKANMKIVHLDNIATGAISVIDIVQKFIVVVVAVILLQQGKIDVAMWLAFFLFSQNLFSYMDQIVDAWVRIKSSHGSFQRIIDIMDGAEEKNIAALPFPKTGDIQFKNVTFTYPQVETPALNDVSFNISRGSSVAIVGLCGSGKTTSVSMLERFYTPDSGQVLIGNMDIRNISLYDFRKKLAYVQQGADVFSGTLREVLTYGIDRSITDSEIFDAAKKTGFSEYLELCNNNLDYEISSGGESMSGGQKQRLVLTRELLHDGDIIIMDEPTSALDAQISAKIQSTMDSIFKGKTRVTITHDLNFAKKYDKILVMDNGKLACEGTHETLMASCETYRQMILSAEEEAKA